VSYGANHYRTAVRLMTLDLESRLVNLEAMRRAFEKAKAEGSPEARNLGTRKRNMSRAVTRTRKRLDKLKLTLEKREEWERMDNARTS